jgi:hypothetical protein
MTIFSASLSGKRREVIDYEANAGLPCDRQNALSYLKDF